MFGETSGNAHRLVRTMSRGGETMEVDLMNTSLEETRSRAKAGWRFNRDEDH